jgi:broad-specificity NMP kinase
VGSLKGGNIVLIGPRACGKSTVGRFLAERLGFDFVDTDEEVGEKDGSEDRSNSPTLWMGEISERGKGSDKGDNEKGVSSYSYRRRGCT